MSRPNCRRGTWGSSPRVRSRLFRGLHNNLQSRIISACAEQTGTALTPKAVTGDHLRVCGADYCSTVAV